MYDYEQEYHNTMAYEAMTQSELIAQDERYFIMELGSHNKDSQWLVSHRDVCYKNPYYNGPDQDHPEEIEE